MGEGESQGQPIEEYQRPTEISIETDVNFYQSIPADPRPGREYGNFIREGVLPTRYDHITTHFVDLKQSLRVQDINDGLNALAQIAQSTGPEVRQFEARKGRTFKYDRSSRVMIVIQEKPVGQEKKAPPPPAYLVTAYPLRNEAKFEQKRLKNQKGLPKQASQAVASV